MREYGEVAIGAAELTRISGVQPPEAWERAAQTVFPHSTSLREKGCPRSAYLGLCEDGFIVSVPSGKYTRSQDNKRYALHAVELLASEPSLANASPRALWERVMGGQKKSYNSQMDVVIALWQNGLININGG
ncbi:DUF6979 family protein [Singulisphaera sp. Ch08]|uniref:DUF6979 family protein n=1 Tax=Singulisphaera sp. Ch08 TaxID=3120278 RepID=UPI0038736D2D